MPAAADSARSPNATQVLLRELYDAPAALDPILGRLTDSEVNGDTGTTITPTEAALLMEHGLAQAANADDPTTPLVIAGDWLCSRRIWRHERDLARQLVDRARQPPKDLAPTVIAALDQHFPPSPKALSIAGIDWQRRAAEVALTHGLALITGGPGCGKTTVAGRIVMLDVLSRTAVPVVVLAAPTGKAAARLTEAVRAALVAAGWSGDSAASVTQWSSTLHRLFHDPRVDQVDLAIIDEVSMASAATLGRVLVRLPATARILLLGDPDQLASVEPGRVLGDLAAVPADHPLATVSTRLRVNWRSDKAPALAGLVEALQGGEPHAERRLETPSPGPSDRTWVHRCDLPASPSTLVAGLMTTHAGWLSQVLDAKDPAHALAALDEVRLVSVLRRGPWGCDAINDLWERLLYRRFNRAVDAHGHYHGRPLLVTGNRPDLGLANGDIGVCWTDPSDRLVVHFPELVGTRTVPLHRLDGLSPAWFLTVHKAQGSQGNQVEVIGLPLSATPGQRQLATREMAYTAITRAAQRVRVWWDRDGLATALANRDIERRRSNFPMAIRTAARGG